MHEGARSRCCNPRQHDQWTRAWFGMHGPEGYLKSRSINDSTTNDEMHFPPDSGMADFSQHGRARAASARPWRSRRLGNLPKLSYQGLTLAYIHTDSLYPVGILGRARRARSRREQTKVVAAPYRVCACNARGGEITDREHASDGTSYFSLSSRISSRAHRPRFKANDDISKDDEFERPWNSRTHASMRSRVFPLASLSPGPIDKVRNSPQPHVLSPGRQQG